MQLKNIVPKYYLYSLPNKVDIIYYLFRWISIQYTRSTHSGEYNVDHAL